MRPNGALNLNLRLNAPLGYTKKKTTLHAIRVSRATATRHFFEDRRVVLPFVARNYHFQDRVAYFGPRNDLFGLETTILGGSGRLMVLKMTIFWS